MKRIILSALLVPVFAGTASAAIVFSEDFGYPDGDLIAQNGGVGFTNAWSSPQATANNINVAGAAAYSNPNSTLQNSQVNRSFSTFSETAFVFTLNYDVTANVEGSYDFHVVLRDSNDLEILSVGNRNNQGAAGEYYVARLGSGGGAQTAWKLGASETYSDTMTISVILTGSTITADISSTAFPAMDVTGLTRDLGSTIDFSSGNGTLRIEKSGLDGMRISADNIQLDAVPEPSAVFALFGLGGLALAMRRRHCA